MVGLDGLEPSTLRLSGVRSNHLSYRPLVKTGGAGRDRTGDLLNANQALSQLSYSPANDYYCAALLLESYRGQLDAWRTAPGSQRHSNLNL